MLLDFLQSPAISTVAIVFLSINKGVNQDIRLDSSSTLALASSSFDSAVAIYKESNVSAEAIAVSQLHQALAQQVDYPSSA